MVNWRDRGFVEDSDGDAEFDDLESQSAGETISPKRHDDAQVQKESQDQANVTPDESSISSPTQPYKTTYQEITPATSEPHVTKHTANYVSAVIHALNDDYDELQDDLSYRVSTTKTNSISGTEGKPAHAQNIEDKVLKRVDAFDVPSSPLSDPSCSPELDFSFQQTPSVLILSSARPPPDVTASSRAYQDNEASRASNGPTEEVFGNAERNLRRRNPIQLHPYLLENEQYRNSLKSRGLRPVVIGSEATQTGGHHNVSQYQTEVNAEESQSNALGSSSQSDLPSSQLSFATEMADREPDLMSDKDDFPDLDFLRSQSLAGNWQQGYKRRKTTHCYSQPQIVTDMSVDGGFISPAIRLKTKDISNSDAELPSPKASRTPPARIEKKRRFKKFRVPKGLLPAPLPTPIGSSEIDGRSLDFFQFDSGSDFEGEQRRKSFLESRHRLSGMKGGPRLTHLTSSSSSSSSDPSVSDSEQIRQVQRQIKGVLPASWLKLDKQARMSIQSPTNVLSVLSVLPSKVIPQRGIARRIHTPTDIATGSRGNYALQTEVLQISDETCSSPTSVMSKSPPTSHRRSPPLRHQHSRILEVDDLDEAQEDNWVDHMPPAASRHRKTGQFDRTLQLKLTDTFERSKKRAVGPVWDGNITSTNKYKPSRKRKTSREKPHRTERARRKVVPRLSILDAPQSIPIKFNPDFIKLASRQARSRPDKGRHSPYRKLISLHSWEDAVELESVVKDWKSGKIVPSRQFRTSVPKALQSRQPLRQQSLNIQRSFAPPCIQKLAPAQAPRSNSNRPGFDDLGKVDETKETSHVAARQQHSRAAFFGRPGQLEELETEHDGQHTGAFFQRTIFGLDSHFHHSSIYRQPTLNPLLTRFLEDEDQSATRISGQRHKNHRTLPVQPVQQTAIPHRQRKRAPQRLYVQDAQYHELPSQESVPDQVPPLSHNKQTPQTHTILGLGPFGTRYTTDFGIRPLDVGTYFHQKTFIGSGELRDALELTARDLDISAVSTNIICGDFAARIGPWTEDVSTQLGVILTRIGKTIQSDLHQFDNSESIDIAPLPLGAVFPTLRSIIQYYSKSLSFLDSVDRSLCVHRSHDVVEKLFTTLMSAIAIHNASEHSSEPKQRMIIHVLMYVAVLAYQVFQIGRHSHIDGLRVVPAELLLRRIAQALVTQLLDQGLNGVRDTFVQLRNQSGRELGIRESGEATEVIVVLDQVLGSVLLNDFSLWSLLSDGLSERLPGKCNSVQVFEDRWFEIFTLLPLVEFDSSGILISGKRFKTSNESWAVVNAMLDQLFDLYARIGNGHAPSLNSYIRAVLSRCYQLVHDWGWRKCEPILKTIFDFFARNHLSFLRNEESKSSARFLEHLSTVSFPIVELGDRSFHIFLKILGAGLIGMRDVYPSKRIGNLAWRFIPAHGRVYKKEEDMRQENLDALRNNHDLLCVLYSACPSPYRLSVDNIRNLVDCATSHAEVCRVNVRSWANLVKFQLSTDEPPTAIEPFASWYNQILRQSMVQHRFARIEAENFFHATADHNGRIISQELLESTISKNQKQIEAVLSTALASMRNIIKEARNSLNAIALVQRSCTAEIFDMIDAKRSQPNTAIGIALEVYQAYFELVNRQTSTAAAQQASEDSQDYGGWPDLDEVTEDAGKAGPTPAIDESIAGSIQHLLSNCFGTENFFDDTLLARVVDLWVTVARHLVVSGQRDWTYYLQHQSLGSWFQLCDTDQTRKFSAYFLSVIMNCDPASYYENSSIFVSAWLVSLVERESSLKFQHRLTTTILNIDMGNLLLQNLPFGRKPQSKRFEIDLAELRDRRLSLLSSVFSNMRQAVEDGFLASSEMAMQLRQEYNSLLKQVMSAMKKTYQEIQLGSSTRGAYVDFVQRVIESLQQYTSDICPVDKFFTESSAFPLPTSDPAYVVGKLKGYGVKLADSGTQKKLAMFLQTVCERAAAETQQRYLIEQLKRSVEGTFEHGDETRPSLRRFLIEAIFPAYVDSALASDCGWILAVPVLEATTFMFDDLVFVTALNEPSSFDCTIKMLTLFVASLRQASESITSSLHEPQVLKLLAALFKTITSALCIIDYIQRSSHKATTAMNLISYFEAFGAFLSTSLSRRGGVDRPPRFTFDTPLYLDPPPFPPLFPGIRAFCARQLHESLSKNWVRHGQEYYILRGSSRRQVVVDIGTIEAEEAGLLAAIEDFNAVLGRMPAFGRGVQGGARNALMDDVFI